MCQKLVNSDELLRRQMLTKAFKSVFPHHRLPTQQEVPAVVAGLIHRCGFCASHAQDLVNEVFATAAFLASS